MPPRHLLTVWDPSYAEDALDAHLRVLLRWAERSRDPADAASPEEDVYASPRGSSPASMTILKSTVLGT